jgi:dimethylglycine dehydrogenase
MLSAWIGDGNPGLVLLQKAVDLVFAEPAGLHLWSFQLGKSLSQTGLGAGGDVGGREYSPEYWPQESGLQRLIKADKAFLNKSAWEKIANLAPREVMGMIEVEARTADATGSEPIFLKDGTPAGQVSSGAYGYGVGQSLAICYLKAGLTKPGDEVHVAILGQDHLARMLAEPPLDPQGARLRG